MKTSIITTMTLALMTAAVSADVAEAWVHRYSNMVSNNDQALKVVFDATGDLIVTGTTAGGLSGQDMLTIKYSGADGSVLWQKRYNNPANGDDAAKAVALDRSGNVIVTGYSIGNASDYQYYTAKYAARDGALLWEKGHSSSSGYDSAEAVAVDGSGNVVLTGSSGSDYYTAKYPAGDGALLWEKRYNGPENGGDGAKAVAVDGTGNVLVTGLPSRLSTRLRTVRC